MDIDMEVSPLLSICVPTFKREYLIDELLQSIYRGREDLSQFEVCITDNSETDETKNLIESKYSDIPNLHYKKVFCKGFMNSIEALKFGNGQFIKLHNDYSIFREDTLDRLIATAKKYLSEKPLIFYTLRGKKPIMTFDSFDSFMSNINYLSTWSTSFAIWKEDRNRIMGKNIEYNYMYPHTTILFREDFKKSFVVDDDLYFINKQPKKKGGYNLVDNFVRIYLTMLREDLVKKNKISQKTYKTIEHRIMRFCASCYVSMNNNDDYTFSFDNKEKLIKEQCGSKGYALFRLYTLAYRLFNIIKPKKCNQRCSYEQNRTADNS